MLRGLVLGVGRVTAGLAVMVGLLVAIAAPASAHTVSGVGTTDWSTKLLSVRPAVPGLSIRVVELGNLLQLTNRGAPVVVLGYQGEPYLRVERDGVWENLNSAATYLNRTRAGTTPIPPVAQSGTAAVRWKKVSESDTVVWHDHRTHWMGGVPPPQVQRAPGRVHLLGLWHVLIRQGSTHITVTGSLTWIPGPHPWPWVAVAAGLALLCLLTLRLRAWRVALAILVGVLVVVDVCHCIGISVTAVGGAGTKVEKFFTGSFYSFVGWGLGGFAAWRLGRGGNEGLLAAAFAGVSVLLFTGLADLSALHRSQAPFALGVGWDRATVTAALGLGLGIALASTIALRRVPPAPLADDVADLDTADADEYPDLRLVSWARPERPDADS